MAELIPLGLFLAACLVLMAGYPVAFSLAGTALVFAFIGELTGGFDAAFLGALPNRLFGIMTNSTLLAVPLFVFMGVMLERSRVAENLLDTISFCSVHEPLVSDRKPRTRCGGCVLSNLGSCRGAAFILS